MISITLKKFNGFDGEGKEVTEQKTYIAPYLKARVVRSAAELFETLQGGSASVKELDLIVDFVVNMFGNQFTADDVWDGLSAQECTPVLTGIIAQVINGVSDKVGAIPNGATE